MFAVNMEEAKKELKIPDKINIFDTTLRDGEQAPGVALTVDEKIRVAQKLDELGVDIIEVGYPAVSEGEKESAKTIGDLGLNAKISSLARVLEKDIDLEKELLRLYKLIQIEKDFEVKRDLEYEILRLSNYDFMLLKKLNINIGDF